ncbi:hypothetical protein R1sor_001275 [Riccia sorocarpa]|uniref:Uncharacterized protein n=1 Tax=Riccia sorocarpa TaxID=122646 RepID=A0ABD3GVJ5_9MARC
MEDQTEGNREGERETEVERIRHELDELFGLEEENHDFGAEEDWEGGVAATDIRPEELYSHLESEGRLKYDIVVQAIHDDSGLPEVFVSRVWDGEKVPEFVGVGSLLEGNDGVYRAGIEVVNVKSVVETLVTKVGVFEASLADHNLRQQREFEVLKLDVTSIQQLLGNLDPGSQSGGLNVTLGLIQGQLSSLAQSKEIAQLQDVITMRTNAVESNNRKQQLLLTVLEEKIQSDVRKLTRCVEARSSKGKPPEVSQVVEALDSKLRSYAEVSRSEQVEGEDARVTVNTLFKEVLRVATPDIAHAARVGRSDKGPRVLLVRFSSSEGRAAVLGNRGLLKGQRIWLDMDLTPAQAALKQKELLKVREANAAGFVAFLRDGHAVITSRRREAAP